VRDLTGARPFFYAQSAEASISATQLDVLRQAPDVSHELDAQFIGDFLLQEVV